MRMKTCLKTTVVLLLCSLSAFAQTVTFDAEGSSAIQGGDVGRARKEAIKNAQSRAVESAAATVLPASVFENNYDALDQRIFRNPEVYSASQIILSESRDAERYRVIVRVAVNMDKLRSDLISAGLLLPREKIPLWMVIVPELTDNGRQRSKWFEGLKEQSQAESALEKIITEYGFRAVTKPGGKLLPADEIEKTVDAAEKILNGGEDVPSSLLKFALGAGAGYLLFGRVQTKTREGMSGAGFKLAFADIELVAVEVSSGRIIGKFSASPALESLEDEGLEARTIKLGISKIKPDFYKTLDSVNPSGSPAGLPTITISVTGITSFDQYAAVRDFLENKVRGVRGVEIVKLSPTEIMLKVKFTGKADTLISSLLGGNFADFKLEDGGEIEGIHKIIIKQKQ